MSMEQNSNKKSFLVIDEKVLPDVFRKVIDATNLVNSGEASNTSEAVKMVGISRSVYYKYRDAVFPYIKGESGGILTIQVVLSDKPGVLMNLIEMFYKANANILTVNQNIPVRGRAFVSISARISNMEESTARFLEELKAVNGVIKIDSISD